MDDIDLCSPLSLTEYRNVLNSRLLSPQRIWSTPFLGRMAGTIVENEFKIQFEVSFPVSIFLTEWVYITGHLADSLDGTRIIGHIESDVAENTATAIFLGLIMIAGMASVAVLMRGLSGHAPDRRDCITLCSLWISVLGSWLQAKNLRDTVRKKAVAFLTTGDEKQARSPVK